MKQTTPEKSSATETEAPAEDNDNTDADTQPPAVKRAKANETPTETTGFKKKFNSFLRKDNKKHEEKDFISHLDATVLSTSSSSSPSISTSPIPLFSSKLDDSQEAASPAIVALSVVQTLPSSPYKSIYDSMVTQPVKKVQEPTDEPFEVGQSELKIDFVLKEKPKPKPRSKSSPKVELTPPMKRDIRVKRQSSHLALAANADTTVAETSTQNEVPAVQEATIAKEAVCEKKTPTRKRPSAEKTPPTLTPPSRASSRIKKHPNKPIVDDDSLEDDDEAEIKKRKRKR
jgi:hypothetical protein